MKGYTTTVIIWVLGIGIAGLVGYFSSAQAISDRISDSKQSTMNEISNDRERIAKVEEAITTIKDDNKTIKEDIKSILKAVNGK